MATTSTFYPSIGALVSVDSIPDVLSFIKPKIQDVLDSVFYRSRQAVEGVNGAQAAYELDLIVPQGIGFDIFDTGFSVVINPNIAGSSIIPVSLDYRWQILDFVEKLI